MAENEEKKGLTEKQLFWVRFALWCVFACVLPVAFIVWRYELFTKVSSIQFGGWGMVACVIIFIFGIVLMKYIKSGMKAKWSFTGQIISGVAKVILPMLAVYLVLNSVRESIDTFVQALGVATVCEAIAIPLNPMPKWVSERTNGAMESAIDYFLAKREEGGK